MIWGELCKDMGGVLQAPRHPGSADVEAPAQELVLCNSRKSQQRAERQEMGLHTEETDWMEPGFQGVAGVGWRWACFTQLLCP